MRPTRPRHPLLLEGLGLWKQRSTLSSAKLTVWNLEMFRFARYAPRGLEVGRNTNPRQSESRRGVSPATCTPGAGEWAAYQTGRDIWGPESSVVHSVLTCQHLPSLSLPGDTPEYATGCNHSQSAAVVANYQASKPPAVTAWPLGHEYRLSVRSSLSGANYL